jgi:type IV pilus assembly protein PilB
MPPAKGMQRSKTVREILIAKGLLTDEQLKAPEETAKKENKTLQQVLSELKLVDDLRMLKVLADEWGFKAVDLGKMEVPKETVELLPEAIATKQRCVPFALQNNVMFLAMADPRDFLVVEDIGLRTGREVKVFLALPQGISKVLDSVYGKADAAQVNHLVESVTQAAPKAEGEDESFSLAEEAEKKDIRLKFSVIQ